MLLFFKKEDFLSFFPSLLDRSRIVLVCLCLALWLPGFFNLPPTDRDESRFALATRQMIETGDYVRIFNGAVPRLKKPIGIHWLQAPFALAARAAHLATQNPIWPYRIASLLGGIIAVLATADIARTLLPDRRAGLLTDGRAGLLAGAMLAASVILTVETHQAKTDAALLGATTLAMSGLARAWAARPMGRFRIASFWLALGAAILIKGPVAPFVIGLTAAAGTLSGGPDEATAGRRGSWLRRLHPAAGVPLLLLVVAPWFVAIGLQTHGAFFVQAVGGDLGGKLAGSAEGHGAPPGLHLLLLPLLSFPSTVPILQGLAASVAYRREPATRFLLAWLLPAWLVFELVPTKLPNYTLPLYPALCLLAADWVTRRHAAGQLAGLQGRLGMAHIATLAANALRYVHRVTPFARIFAGLVAVALAGAALWVPRMLHAPPWLGAPAVIAAGLAAWQAWRARPLIAALCVVPLYAALLHFELPNLTELFVSPRAATAVRAAWPSVPATGDAVFVVGYAEPSLMFLLGPKLSILPTGKLAAEAWRRPPHAAALIAAPDNAAFLAEATRLGTPPVRASVVTGVNSAHGKGIVLNLYVR